MAKRRSKRPGGSLILAIDQGTTGTKALLIDAKLRVVAEHSEEFPQHFPKPGWVEHEPDEIFTSVSGAVKGALRRAKRPASAIAAIGITNQRETTVLWDKKTGRPLHRAIVWQDRRTADRCRALKERGLERTIRRKTGLVLDPYFSGTKAAWILDKIRGARRRAERGEILFGTIDTYLLWRLTGGEAHATDISNASRTLLMDLKIGAWSPQLCAALDVPVEILPEIRPNDATFGHTRGVRFLPDGIPVTSLIGDQQSALFGQVCFRPGEAKCTYGTGAFLVVNTGEEIVRSRHGVLTTAGWQLGSKRTYALEGSSFIAGAVVQWLRDGLGLIDSAAEIESLAASVESSDGVVLVPALAGLGAPHWDADARGLICGLTRGTTRAHLARAALEGMALQIGDLVRAMEADLGRRFRSLKVDGGASLNDLLMQFQADMLGVKVVRPKITSTTALGAALLAGLGVGMFSSPSAIRSIWAEERSFRRAMAPAAVRRHTAQWEDAIARTRSTERKAGNRAGK